MYTIYLITNTSNQKKYVGITTETVHKRWVRHCYESTRLKRQRQYPFHRAIRKHGEQAFVVEEIGWTYEKETAFYLERAHIILFNTHGSKGHGYNSTYGGEGAFGLVWSEESKLRAREACRKRWTPEERKRVSELRRGKPSIKRGRAETYYTYNGKTQGLYDWAREYGIPANRLFKRLHRGWTFPELLITPSKRK